jgi:collagenase-like PrtC family protease
MARQRPRILAALTASGEVEPLARAGADEFFCGVLPGDLVRSSRAFLYLNRRAAPSANFASVADLRAAIATADRLGRSVLVTFNELFYAPEVEAAIVDLVADLDLHPPHGVIVANTGLILALRERWPDLRIASGTGFPVFNRGALAFLKGLGVARVTLPSALTRVELATLVRESKELDLEVECFVLNDSCCNTNALCTYYHDQEGDGMALPFCRLPKDFVVRRATEGDEARAAGRLGELPFRMSIGCGACEIPALADAGCDALKVVGRLRGLDGRVRNLGFIQAVLDECGGPGPGPTMERVKALYRRVMGASCGGRCVYG